MECELERSILPGEEEPISDTEIYGLGDGEGDDVYSTVLKKTSSLTSIGLSKDEPESTEAQPPSEPKKRFTLSRGISLKNVVNGMKRKAKDKEEVKEEQTKTEVAGDTVLIEDRVYEEDTVDKEENVESVDSAENEQPKATRQIYFSKVFDRISHGTNRMWTSLGKTFTNGSSPAVVPDMSDQKAGSSKTLGRLFGRTFRVSPVPEVQDPLQLEIPSAEAKSQSLGRKITSTLKLIKPTKN